MDIQKIAIQLLQQHFGGSSTASDSQLGSALQNLLGGKFDIASLVEKFSQGGGIANQLQSWLGDGSNQAISADNIMQMFGNDSVNQFAGEIGVDSESAAEGLSNVIPGLIDKCSSGGSLLESVGGLDGALNMAKGLFGKN